MTRPDDPDATRAGRVLEVSDDLEHVLIDEVNRPESNQVTDLPPLYLIFLQSSYKTKQNTGNQVEILENIGAPHPPRHRCSQGFPPGYLCCALFCKKNKVTRWNVSDLVTCSPGYLVLSIIFKAL